MQTHTSVCKIFMLLFWHNVPAELRSVRLDYRMESSIIKYLERVLIILIYVISESMSKRRS